MYYSWEKIIKNCQYFVCIRVHSLYIILCGSTFGFNYISNSVWIGLHQHRTSGFYHFIPPFVQKSSNCEKTSSSQPSGSVHRFVTDLKPVHWQRRHSSALILFFFLIISCFSWMCDLDVCCIVNHFSFLAECNMFCTKISLYLF